METTKAGRVREYAAQTVGTTDLYSHGLLRSFMYTDGVRYMAETCGAYWLVDLIASHQLSAKVRREPFQVWYLKTRADGSWVAEAWTDSPLNGKRIVRQEIPYSDFPTDLAPFRLYVENRTLMLPEER